MWEFGQNPSFRERRFSGVAEVWFNPILVGAAPVYSDSTLTFLILVA